jgi:hypothetical protein
MCSYKKRLFFLPSYEYGFSHKPYPLIAKQNSVGYIVTLTVINYHIIVIYIALLVIGHVKQRIIYLSPVPKMLKYRFSVTRKTHQKLWFFIRINFHYKSPLNLNFKNSHSFNNRLSNTVGFFHFDSKMCAIRI